MGGVWGRKYLTPGKGEVTYVPSPHSSLYSQSTSTYSQCPDGDVCGQVCWERTPPQDRIFCRDGSRDEDSTRDPPTFLRSSREKPRPRRLSEVTTSLPSSTLLGLTERTRTGRDRTPVRDHRPDDSDTDSQAGQTFGLGGGGRGGKRWWWRRRHKPRLRWTDARTRPSDPLHSPRTVGRVKWTGCTRT